MSREDWRIPFKSLQFLVLREGPGNGVQLDIAPTMRTLVYSGERYFRMPSSRAVRDDGSYGASYLWDRYWDADQIAARKAAAGVE